MALSVALVLEMVPVALQGHLASGDGQGFPPTQMPSPAQAGSLHPGCELWHYGHLAQINLASLMPLKSCVGAACICMGEGQRTWLWQPQASSEGRQTSVLGLWRLVSSSFPISCVGFLQANWVISLQLFQKKRKPGLLSVRALYRGGIEPWLQCGLLPVQSPSCQVWVWAGLVQRA